MTISSMSALSVPFCTSYKYVPDGKISYEKKFLVCCDFLFHLYSLHT